MSSGSEGTEPPTEHKLQEARKKGDSPLSSDFSHAAATLLWALLLTAMGGAALGFFVRFVTVLLVIAPGQHDAQTLGWSALHLGLGIAPVCVVGLFVALAPELLQSRGRWASKREWFDIQRINPIARIKSMFALPRLLQLPLSFLRFVIVAALAWHVFTMILPMVRRVSATPWFGSHAVAWWAALRIVLVSSAICLVLGVCDLFIQKALWRRRNRMKKEEVQREHKEQEGDPEIKGRRRQAHQESVS